MNRTLVKICGLTRPEDAHAAAAAGADAIGLVLWPGSRRYIDLAKATQIRKSVPDGVRAIGVFVDSDVDSVRRAAAAIGLDGAQLCGRIVGDGWTELATNLTLIRAVGVSVARPADASLRHTFVADYLVDNGSTGAHGGAGMAYNWTLATPVQSWGRVWLAGGLTPDNVADAVQAVHPYAVDVSTGVESAPGIKSPELIAAFVAAVRHLDQSSTRESTDAR